MLDSLFEGSAFKMFWCDGLGASAQRMPGDADAKRGSPSLTLQRGRTAQARPNPPRQSRASGADRGPSDVLIEPNIAAGAAPREVPPPRPVPTGDTLRRAVPLGEGKHVAAAARTGAETGPLLAPNRSRCDRRCLRLNQPRTGRRANRRSLNPASRSAPGPPGAYRSTVRPLGGIGPRGVASEPEASELPVWLTTRREPRLRSASAVVTPPAPAPATDAKLGPSADQNNLANTAQRLEAVMRRPNRKEGTSAPPAAPKMEKPVRPV